MKNLVRIDSQYVRDVDNMTIINTDSSHYETIKASRLSSSEINDVQKKVDELKEEFGEIKDLLLQIIGNKNG